MCGIAAVVDTNDVAQTLAQALASLEHRGEFSSGMTTWSAHGRLSSHVGAGEPRRVFAGVDWSLLPGTHAIGHTRYPTTTDKRHVLRDCQPLVSPDGRCAVACNGHLDAEALFSRSRSGWVRRTGNDAEALLMELCSGLPALGDSRDVFHDVIVPAVTGVMEKLDGCGSFAAVALVRDAGLLAIRDPYGFRPLHIGRLPGSAASLVVASETTAFDAVGAVDLGELHPGELLFADRAGRWHRRVIRQRTHAFCALEAVYFSAPESRVGRPQFHDLRRALGRALAAEHNSLRSRIDIVVPVPDTGIPAAHALAEAWAKPFGGVIKRRAIRGFLEPSEGQRQSAAETKYALIDSYLRDRRIALVDDSIVRGTTLRSLVRRLRVSGVEEVHVLSSFPPVMHPCRYGIDIPTRGELVAARYPAQLASIAAEVGADSVNFVSERALRRALSPCGPVCLACVTGHAPDEAARRSEAPVASVPLIRL